LAEVGDYKAIYRIAKMRSLSVKGMTCGKYNVSLKDLCCVSYIMIKLYKHFSLNIVGSDLFGFFCIIKINLLFI